MYTPHQKKRGVHQKVRRQQKGKKKAVPDMCCRAKTQLLNTELANEKEGEQNEDIMRIEGLNTRIRSAKPYPKISLSLSLSLYP